MNSLIYINKFLDRSCNRFKQIIRLYECEKLLNQSTIYDIPEGYESDKTTATDTYSVSFIINSENLLNINYASINKKSNFYLFIQLNV